MRKRAAMTVAEAAAIMGVTPQFLRLALQRREFPFGAAVKMEKRWVYYINPERFRRWMAGEDMAQAGNQEAERHVAG